MVKGMRKNAFILGLAVLAAAAWAAPSFANRAIRGSVGNVQAADGPALGQVGFRVWSAQPGGTTVINQANASCVNVRCMKNYVTNTNLNPGGYIGNGEGTGVYNDDANAQPFYELADASMNDGAGNHIGYYGVAGVSADNLAGIGDFLKPGCPTGNDAQNCFGRLDNTVAAPPLLFTSASFGGPAHTIRAIGGLNPIPTVRVAKISGGGTVDLTWNDPPTYDAAMRAGGVNAPQPPPSPVLGVNLWKLNSPSCTDPTAADAWVKIGPFNNGNNTTTQPLPPPDGSCDYYALTVRFTGPGGAPHEVETFRVGANSQGVSSAPTAVRITRFEVTYAGHGVVHVSWQSGVEGGLSGFYVTRSSSSDGHYADVSELIRAKGDNSLYSATDHVNAGNARVYYYRLEAVGRDGSVTTSSTAAVTLPTRSRKAGPAVR